jgi:hypothetical protein
MAEADRRKTGVLLTIVLAALAVVVWLWVGGRSSTPRTAPAPPSADAVQATKPTRTPAVGRVANPKPGDVNADGVINADDAGYLSDFVSGQGQAPIGPADVNGDGKVDVQDLKYLINYLYAGGPPPRAPRSP